MNISNRGNREHVTEKGLAYCGIPREVVRITQSDIFALFENNTAVYDALRGYFEHFADNVSNNVWVYVKGSKCANRDVLSGYLAKYAYSRNMDVAYITSADLFDLYYSRMDCRDGEDSVAEKEKFDNLRNKEYLVIASVGAEMYRKSNEKVLLALLEYRSDNGLPTVLSSNKKLSEIFTDSDVSDIAVYLRKRRFTVRCLLTEG